MDQAQDSRERIGAVANDHRMPDLMEGANQRPRLGGIDPLVSFLGPLVRGAMMPHQGIPATVAGSW